MNLSSPRVRKFDGLWAAILLVLVSAIAYLPMIRQFGYYFDDWNLIWGGHTYGPQKFIELYSIDRPFVGIVFAQIYPFLGDSALPWNIAAYLLRLASGLGFLWLVRMLWPRQTLATTLMALLFLIYPGFLRQPNAIQYLAHLIGFSMGVWSIAISIRVTRLRSGAAAAVLVLLAAIFGLVSFLMMEYFIGLEGVRLILLWYVTPKTPQEKLTARAWRVLRRWLPYLVAFSGFLIWRLFFFKSSRVATSVDLIAQNYLQAPLYQAVRVVFELGKDFFEATLFGWFVPSYQLISGARLRDFGYSLLLAGLGVALVVLSALWVRRQQAEPAAKAEGVSSALHWSRDAIWLGALTTLSTALPIILANRGISFSSSFDRYTLPSTLGVAMLVTGLIFYTRQPGLRLGIPLLLVAISLMTHYNNGVFFSGYWQTQRSFWWQMSWRAPQLQPDTVLIADLPGSYPIEEDYEIWGPANLIYYPQPGPLKITSEVLNTPNALNIKLGVETSRTMRLVEVVRDFANTLVLSMPTTSSCLHVIDSERPELSQNEGALIHFVAPSSHVDRIETDVRPQRPPENIFGPEPSHDTWCYYYQKASLARQKGDWEEVVRLGDEAQARGLRARDYAEWMPFVDGYVYTGRYDTARGIIPIVKEYPSLKQQVCNQLANPTQSSYASFSQEGIDFLTGQLCN